MLALTRRINESVIINHNIKIVIVDVSGDKVRVGVEAPAGVVVLRSELVKDRESMKKSENCGDLTQENAETIG